nr:hypothetical protein [Tanacetum cinerariifolium]
MYEKYIALIRNSTWILLPKPPNANVVRSMWLFWHKYHVDGSLSRHLVLGFNGLLDMHYELGFLRVDRIIPSLHKEFDMTDLGDVNYFLGISVTRDSTSMFLSQKKYAMELLDRHIWLLAILLGLRRSTSGYCVFFGDNLLSWSCKRQHTLSRSSVEAQYRGVANRTKHIEINMLFVRDMVARGHARVLHVPSRYQCADIFTKGLSSALFQEFRSSLIVRSSPALTAREC